MSGTPWVKPGDQIFIKNSPTAPTQNTTGGTLYSDQSGNLKFKDKAGKVSDAAPGRPKGFLHFGTFQNASTFANASKTAAASANNPWMKGARWWTTGTENLCQTSDPSTSQWDTDIAALTGYSSINPFDIVMPRITFSPSLANYDITLAASTTRMDTVMGGICNQINAAGSRDLCIDPENYSGSDISMLFNHDQGGNALKNVGALSRAARCQLIEDFGRSLGGSFWSRVPGGRLHCFFASTQVGGWTGSPSGTQAPTTMADGAYSGNAIYNMLPYFYRGLLDACPSDGVIYDYCEGGMYGFPGVAAMARVMGYSNNWMNVFFSGDSGLVEKAKTVWKAVPMLYPDCYFAAKGTQYAGANFTILNAGSFVTGKSYKIKTVGTTTIWTNWGASTGTLGEVFVATGAGSGDGVAYSLSDQKAQFTRNALYALQMCPDGAMPALYMLTASCDPWAASPINLGTPILECLNEALAVYQGKQSLTMSNALLAPLLNTYFTGRTDYQKERF